MENRLDLSEVARKLLRLHFAGRSLSMPEEPTGIIAWPER
jgi:hypothetical protein